MQVPTNYKMGTGLAASIMGQQTALEQEKMGLENLYKGMEMPANALKAQEAAMLAQNPEYLQQKVANTMVDLRNQYSASDFQQTLNAANRVGLELDAAGGDPNKEQQIVQKALTALKIDPSSEFGQYAMKDPRGALTKFKQGVETSMIGAQGGKHLADMEKERFTQGEQTKRTEMDIAGRAENARISAGATLGAARINADYKDQAQLGNAIKEAGSYVKALQTGLTKLATEEGKNEAINNLISSQGLTKDQATSAVNSGAYKQSLQTELESTLQQYEHLKKQSPYYKGFNFGNKPQVPTSNSLPAGVTLKSK